MSFNSDITKQAQKNSKTSWPIFRLKALVFWNILIKKIKKAIVEVNNLL